MPKYLSIQDEVAFREHNKAKDRHTLGQVHDAFTNNGKMFKNDDSGDITEFSLKDLVTQQDLTRFIPQSVEIVVREALEPNLFIVNRLFQSVNIPRGSRIQIGAIGAMEAGRVGQGGEYPERFVDLDGGDMIALSTDKYGLKISMTQEVIEDNLFDVVGVWLRAAGRALARHKERQGAKLINEMGYDVFDNINPTNSYIGSTTGRDISGTPNGTLTVNDTFGMYAYLLHRGFTPDVLLMHPLAWKTFMTDTEMREVVLNGSTVSSYKLPNGDPAAAWGTSHGKLGLRTTATGRETTSGNNVKGGNAFEQTLNPLGATFNIAPRYLPTPLEVIVTHYVPFRYGTRSGAAANETTKGSMTNVIMVDSDNCAILGQEKDVTMDTWTDPERDIENMKLKEIWGMGILEQGKAIAVARNISTERNYNFENVNQQTLSEHTQDSGILTGPTL
tara:strand:+ start:990 stop:2327 length:1338 start_codon:yes stop_codon:yes gene_type:complete